MENSNERTLPMKTFAVIGFLLLIIFFVWLAVQIVSLIPGAFSSLASLADSVYNERPQTEIMVSNGNSIVNSNEPLTVNWNDVKRDGFYTFSYECADGVALDIRHPGNSITPVACGEIISLGNMIYSLVLLPKSEKNRFVDISYTIGFSAQDSDVVDISKTTTFTVVNANIPPSGTGEVVVTDPEVVEPEVTAPVVTAPVVTTPTKPAVPHKPVIIKTPIYAIPVSDPNGTVDLAVRVLAVGSMNSKNVFVPGSSISNDERGAFQFEVKNLGTKTSADWTFDATLTSGSVFTSEDQNGLKPNERSVITIGFDDVGTTGTKTFSVSVAVKSDVNTKNNGFSSAVVITN